MADNECMSITAASDTDRSTMKTLLTILGKHLRRVALFALAVLAPGLAQAQTSTYNIFLKNPGTSDILSCATGGFTFTKPAVVPPVPLTATVTITVTASCVVDAGTYTGLLDVIVENVTLNGQDQGPNVVGLFGTLSLGGASIGFAYGAGSASTPTPIRTLTFTPSGGPVALSTYHLYNAVCIGAGCLAVPEPGALWLVLTALAALYVAQRLRRRR